MERVSLKQIKVNKYSILLVIGFVVSFYVFINTPDMKGCGLYFTIPLTWSIAAFTFNDIFPYHRDGIALKIFYVVTFAKYIVAPIVVCYVGAFSTQLGTFSASAYFYAIFIQDIEILFCFGSIKYFYWREFNKFSIELENRTLFYDRISAGGMIIIIMAIGLIAMRGIDRILVTMRVGIVTESLAAEDMYGYDIWLAHTMLGFLVITATDTFCQKNDKHESFFNVLIPTLFVALSCILIFGNNRATIMFFAFCGLMVLTRAFPRKRKLFYSIIIPTMIAIVFSFTLMKQFGYNVSTGEYRGSTRITDAGIVESLSSYLCGTESIAKTFHLYGINGDKMQLLTPFSDLVHKTTILGLPGLNKIVKLFENVPTSYSLAMYATEIVPVSGQTLFYGGYVLGPVLDLVANIFLMKLLIRCEIRGKRSREAADVYIYTWLGLNLALCMTRSLAVMYSNAVGIPLFIFVATRANRWIQFRIGKRQRIEKVEDLPNENY